MDNKTLFTYEMLDTPTLAQECHRLKAQIDEQSHFLTLGKGDRSYKQKLMADLKKAKAILKSRQMRMNF